MYQGWIRVSRLGSHSLVVLLLMLVYCSWVSYVPFFVTEVDPWIKTFDKEVELFLALRQQSFAKVSIHYKWSPTCMLDCMLACAK